MSPQDRQRRRLTVALFVGNALASTAFIAAISVASIVAAELAGSTRLAGVPSALGTAGSALGAYMLTAMSRHTGRRAAFSLGLLVSAVGGAIGASSLSLSSFGALTLALFVMGFGRSVTMLSRFAAGDLWPDNQRASAIGFVVWAATIGSVLGPVMLIPASRMGATYLGTELAGPFAFAGAGFGLAAVWYFATLRPEPLTLATGTHKTPAAVAHGHLESDTDNPPLRTLIRHPGALLSLLTLAVSQFVMILVMTMTPLHIHGHHHGLTVVGGVMMAHTLGMFAIAPLTGYLVDHLGARRMIAAGSIVLALSALLIYLTDVTT